jgi:enediyne biosynthesis protein E4
MGAGDATGAAHGAAFGDLFHDGHIDVVLNNLDSKPALLRNVVHNGNHWLTLKLIGDPRSPRDAIGAKVLVTAGGVRQRMDLISGGSYLSSSDLRPHFGWGTAKTVDAIEIDWPSGRKQILDVNTLNRDGLDRMVTVQEGNEVSPLQNSSSPANKAR